MENTLENKAKLFALYWGQKLIYFNEINLVTRDIITPSKINPVYVSYPCIKYAVLELTPLSQITDEDAIEVGLINSRKTREEYRDLKNFIHNIKFFFLSKDAWTSFGQADYLRSKGYAIPWMGISVEQQIKFGWVKLKEN